MAFDLVPARLASDQVWIPSRQMSAHSYARVHDGRNPVRISGHFLRLTPSYTKYQGLLRKNVVHWGGSTSRSHDIRTLATAASHDP